MFYRGYGFEIFTKIRLDSPEVIPHGNIPHGNIGQGAGPIEAFGLALSLLGNDKLLFFTCPVSTILTRKLLLSNNKRRLFHFAEKGTFSFGFDRVVKIIV